MILNFLKDKQKRNHQMQNKIDQCIDENKKYKLTVTVNPKNYKDFRSMCRDQRRNVSAVLDAFIIYSAQSNLNINNKIISK